MIHLHKDIWLDADEYQFSFMRKSIYKKGEREGKERFLPFSNHSTSEQVSRKIIDIGLKELCNSDYSTAMSKFEEMHSNFVAGLPKLTKKRYGCR